MWSIETAWMNTQVGRTWKRSQDTARGVGVAFVYAIGSGVFIDRLWIYVFQGTNTASNRWQGVLETLLLLTVFIVS